MDEYTYENWLALLCVWREARNQSLSAQIGVWWVLHNRVGKPMFRPSLVRVVLQPWAFSSFNANDSNVTKFPNEASTLDWQSWEQIITIPGLSAADPTDGAVYYESEPLEQLDELRAKAPWFAADNMTVQIDAVRFYHA